MTFDQHLAPSSDQRALQAQRLEHILSLEVRAVYGLDPMRYLPLVWSGVCRNKVRSGLTMISVALAFTRPW
jgi:hypothetical protein